MKKILLKNIFSLIILIILSLTLYEIIKLDIIPNKYLMVIIIGEVILYLLGLIIYNLKNKLLIIFGIILYLISALGNIPLYYFFNKTNNYIETNFVKETYKVETNYYLITNINNPVNSPDEISKEESIYYYQYSEAISLALKELGDYQYISTNEAPYLINRVKVDNIYFLLPSNDYNFIIEASYENNDQIKIIKEFTVVEEFEVDDNTPSSYNICLTGYDYSGYRRDYNLLITVNTKTRKIVLTSIPRDYYIPFKSFGGAKDSLTNTGSISSEITKEALEDLFNTKIDYTVDVYTKSLVNVVDQIGGVEFCSNYSFYTTHDLTLGSYDDRGEKLYVQKGCYTYNGLETLAIARERMHVNTDRERQDNCRKILINIAKKIASNINISNYAEILDSFEGLYNSNINKKIITNLLKEFLNDQNFEIIEQSVDGVDGQGPTRYGTGTVWTLDPYMDQVESASEKINLVLNEN